VLESSLRADRGTDRRFQLLVYAASFESDNVGKRNEWKGCIGEKRFKVWNHWTISKDNATTDSTAPRLDCFF